jgi:hypothetical protein
MNQMARSVSEEGVSISLLAGPTSRVGDLQGALSDLELDQLGGIAASTTDWGKCPGTPTAGSDCCVGGTAH